MKRKHLLDSVILIDHLNGNEKATKWLASLSGEEGVLSPITRAEVLTGVSDEDRPAVLEFLDDYPCLSVTAATADEAAGLRRRHKWKLPDAFQAALARENGLLLATRNTKDFSETDHAFVEIPYK